MFKTLACKILLIKAHFVKLRSLFPASVVFHEILRMTEFKTSSLVPVFDGTNYAAWKIRLLAILAEQDFVECIKEVSHNEEGSAEDSAGKSREKFKMERVKKDKKCKTLLPNSMSDNQIVNTQFCKSAYKIWSTLASVYDRKIVAKRLHVTR